MAETMERPLAFADQGSTVRISRIRLDKQDTLRHLESLGFVEGGEVRVIADQLGNLIVEIKGSRVAVNRATAMKIMVG
ncbi:FeoA family protein [Gordonibacter sp. Marseille-P4307]|uniref:FeoA family protein n=1 Tax=Gordonibacter sp. Marseille-P4307 TaxID=2161815 RepID=UPI001F150053|nr:FeoA family protein [Gordonibacter sp. Marseille-P4307]